MSDIVQKLWGFCHTLRHDGIDYGDYIEQITYLLFLKMADERGIAIPKDCDWPTLRDYTGTELTDHYIDILRKLGKSPGLLGDIYAGAQSRFKNPVNLKKLIGLIDETEWTALDVDVKAAAYEGLLEKAASEGKKGAGQYFTPRVLIQSIVRCMKPDPRVHRDFTICDPACGTGGFLVASYEWLKAQTKGGALDRDAAKRIRTATYFGQDLVDRPRRMALMNLYLHNIEPQINLGDAIYEPPAARRFDVVLTNPPFGTKGANQAPDRDDLTVSTSNKQLNFVQHVLTILKPGGRAAIVLPDNCLFADQGRRGLQDRYRGLRPAYRPALAARHLHALQPRRQSQRRLLHQGRQDRANLDLRCPHQRPRHHQKRPPIDLGTLRRVRKMLRQRPKWASRGY
jgi:type I restriction enzyme M protein